MSNHNKPIGRLFVERLQIVTAEGRFQFKAGYINKKFDNSEFGETDTFSVEAQIQHNFNPKRAISVNAYRSFRESSIDIEDAAYTVLTTGIDLALLQRFNTLWSGKLNAFYYRDEFEGAYTVDGQTREREDDTFRIGPALIYAPREWANFELGYYYSQRDSNFDIYDFENNTVFFGAEFPL